MVRFYVDGILERTINNNGEEVRKLGTLRTQSQQRLIWVIMETDVDFQWCFGRGALRIRCSLATGSSSVGENQKPLQLLVGPLVQDGDEFSVSKSNMEMEEEPDRPVRESGRARKVYWVLQDGDQRRSSQSTVSAIPLTQGG